MSDTLSMNTGPRDDSLQVAVGGEPAAHRATATEPARARQGDVVVRTLSDELLVYDLRRHKAHCLNQAAALVWQNCDGTRTVPQLRRIVEEHCDRSVDDDVVWYALDKLEEASLLARRPPRPAGEALTRRRMLRTLGVAVLVPAVTSILAPTAAQATTLVMSACKVATGQCNMHGMCHLACCTGGNPQRLCIHSLGVGDCSGDLCEPLGSASDCSTATDPNFTCQIV